MTDRTEMAGEMTVSAATAAIESRGDDGTRRRRASLARGGLRIIQKAIVDPTELGLVLGTGALVAAK